MKKLISVFLAIVGIVATLWAITDFIYVLLGPGLGLIQIFPEKVVRGFVSMLEWIFRNEHNLNIFTLGGFICILGYPVIFIIFWILLYPDKPLPKKFAMPFPNLL